MGVIVTDRNAASSARFSPASTGLIPVTTLKPIIIKKSCVPKCLSPTVYPLTTYLEPMYPVERAREDSVVLHLSFLLLSMLTCSSTIKEERL
jgi:hypothetical protein